MKILTVPAKIISTTLSLAELMATKSWLPMTLFLLIYAVFMTTRKNYIESSMSFKIFILIAFVVLALEVIKAVGNAMSGNKNTIDNGMAALIAMLIVGGVTFAYSSNNRLLKDAFLTFPMAVVFLVNFIDFILASIAQDRVQRRDINVGKNSMPEEGFFVIIIIAKIRELSQFCDLFPGLKIILLSF